MSLTLLRTAALVQGRGGASGGPLYDPVLWLSADDPALGLSNNAPVATWASRVGSLTFTQATGTQQPLFITNVLGGLPVIRFDGSNDRLVSGTSDLASMITWSIFLLGIPRRISGQGWFCRVASGSGVADFWFMCRQGETGGATNKLSVRWFPEGYDYSLHPTPTLSLGTPYRMAWTLADTFQGKLYANGTLQGSVSGLALINPATKLPTPITIGSLRNAGSIVAAQIDVAEILVYNYAVSDAQRADIDAYLVGKYGL